MSFLTRKRCRMAGDASSGADTKLQFGCRETERERERELREERERERVERGKGETERERDREGQRAR